MKILIIGAGPTGLTAALEFTRRGIIPEIVDAKSGPSELSRAVGILPESITKLEAFGVGKKILEEGIKFKRLRMHRGHKVILNLDLSKVLDEDDLIVSLPQNRTEAIMSSVLEENGVQVKYGHKVTEIHTDQEEVSVTFLDGESKKYDWVIAADGVNSTAREKLGIKYIGYDLPEMWSIADVELNEETDPELFSQWIIEGPEKDIAVMVPLAPNRVRLISSTPDCVNAVPLKLDIKKIVREGTFKISARQAETYSKGRVLLAGDSAHTHSPVGGKGMNLGIDDAVAVVKSIVENTTHEYSDERQKIGARIIRDTEKIRKILVSNNPFIKVLLGLTLFLIQHLYLFNRTFMQKVTRL